MLLVSIGRFSKMTRLSVKALRLYGEIGLLLPARTDASSGYRYYHPGQLYRAETIRALRSVDMPLDEIRAILDTKDKALSNEVLVSHRKRLSERVLDQERMLANLESIIQHKKANTAYEVSVTEEKAQLIAAVRIRTNLSQIPGDIATGFDTLMRGLSRAGVSPTGAPMIVYHHVIDEESDGDIEICVPVEDSFVGDAEVRRRGLPGGTMANTVHRGPYDQIGPVYHILTSWIFEHSFEITGPPREVYLNDPQTVAPGELLTRIEYSVRAVAGSD